jgi:hypothetical protein
MENPKLQCGNCRRQLDIGVDVLSVEEGVIGMKGFIPLEKSLLFCCEKCLCEYFDLNDLPKYPGRIP